MRVILFNQLLFDDESLVVVLDLNEIIEWSFELNL